MTYAAPSPAEPGAASGRPAAASAPLPDNAALMLWRTSERLPEQAAVVDRDESTTYRDLRIHAAAVAAALRDAGVAPGDRVGIFLDRGAAAAAVFYGVLACGAIAVNVNERLRARQIEHILGHCEATVLITTAQQLRRLPRPLVTSTRILECPTRPQAAEFEPVPRVAPDIAQIIYTSGSTGLPKGVTITHGNLWSGMWAVTSYVRITAADRIASLLPFSFDYGLNQLLCAVGTGATLLVERSPSPQDAIAALAAQGVTVLPCVPPLWLQLLGAPAFHETPIPTLRAMTNTGGRIPVDGVRRLRTAQPQAQLFLMYGLTEAFRATYLPPHLVDGHPDSIGIAIPGSEILVLREDLTPCAPDEPGELVQRGPTVAAGYWNDPETTARVYRANPLRPAGAPDSERVVFSGDVVRRSAEGLLYFVGRRDALLKRLGFRVSPDEIVDVLHASGQVAEALVGADPQDGSGEGIVAYVVLREAGSLAAVQRFCGTELPRHLQPTRFEVRTELPRTSSGKFDLRAAHAESEQSR